MLDRDESDELSEDEVVHVELVTKPTNHFLDNESCVSTIGGRDDQEGLDDTRPIQSLYLQRQESDPETEKYRQYMENKDIFRANRRQHLFKQAETHELGGQKIDYSRYKKRVCYVGIPTTEDKNICGCGRHMDDTVHEQYKLEEKDRGIWKYKDHTLLSETDAYGRVIFSSHRKAKYVRVDTDTSEKEIFELLTTVFNLQTPGVILSVIGSLKGFCVSPKIEKIIQRGMIKAAITTNGWITTSGFNAGHVISVGKALRAHNHSVPCIGFPSWGCLPEVVQKKLIVRESQMKDGVNQSKCPEMKIEPGSSRSNLNANHSHFIISDTGAVADWGSETYLRTALEAYMKDTMHIPVVQVVIQGGRGVARHLHETLKAGTTAVLVYGSGGVSDVIVDLIRHEDSLRHTGPERKRHKFSKNLTNKSRRSGVASPEDEGRCTCVVSEGISMSCPTVIQIMITGDLNEEAMHNKSFLNRMKEMVSLSQYRGRLILFDMEDQHCDGLDTALLEALVKAQNMTDEAAKAARIQLSGVQVALGWNRPDFAEKLLNADHATKDEKALGSILIHALAWNLYDFTELLLTHGASIPMVAANMALLYSSSSNVDHLKRYVRYHLGVSHHSEINLNKKTVDKMINKLSGSENNFDSNMSNESDPYFELMVWASLALYPEIAELMWSNTQEPIKGALFVLIVLRKMHKSKRVLITNHEKETVIFMRRRFEQLAIDILDGLHQNCEIMLHEKALNSGWGRLNDMSYIDMAFVCRAKDFVAHSACQELQDKRWKRGLTSEVGFFTTVVVFLCPVLVLSPLVTFRRSWVYKGPNDNLVTKWARKFKAFCISPCVKFWMEVAMYVLFVVYQTFVILKKVDKTGENCTVNTEKIILFFWFGILLIDELMQGVSGGSFWKWFRIIWNKIDAAMYLFNIMGLILVHIPAKTQVSVGSSSSCKIDQDSYDVGRVMLSISSIMFIVRLVHMFISDKNLGPTVLMINKMMGDFRVFIMMFMMIAIAFGVGYAVVLTDPSDFTSESAPTIFSGIFFYTMFQMYGELFVDDLASKTGATYFPLPKSDIEPTPTRSTLRTVAVIFLIAIYMAMVVLMLVNILIAMFSNTYSKIKAREDVVFKYQRLELLMEMEESYLPPPFSIVHFILGKIIDRNREKHYRKNQKLHEQDNKWYDTIIRSAIIDCLEDYMKKKRNESGSETETLLRNNKRLLKDKVYHLQRYIENLNSNMQNGFAELRSLINTE